MLAQTRQEFIRSTHRRAHFLDVRATVGQLTMSGVDQRSSRFRTVDVWEKLRQAGPTPDERFRLSQSTVGFEVTAMINSGLVTAVRKVHTAAKEGGTHYEIVSSDQAEEHWGITKRTGLAVLRLFPDDPRNQVWEEFVLAPRESAPPEAAQ